MTGFLKEAFPSAAIRRTSIARARRDGSPGAAEILILRSALGLLAEKYLQLLRRTWPGQILFFVACGSPEPASLLPAGLDDFCFCPFQPYDLVARIKRCHKFRHRPFDRNHSAPALNPSGLVGRSPKFLEALARIKAFAQSNASVLLEGETGTGKELFARALHYWGARSDGPFIPVNCGALPEALFENELFGHRKGAYTNASSSSSGLVAEAAAGTLFLDEVDALSPSCQVKLLRFLQDRQYRPLGSGKTIQADVRVVAATNTSLRAKVEARVFREDLFQRLNVLTVSIPALRDRVEDIEALAQHFLTLYAREYEREPIRLDQPALYRLLQYSWPGNVRELETTLHRAIVLAEKSVLSAGDLDLYDASATFGPVAFHGAKHALVSQFETAYLRRLLAEHHGNVSRAARAAGKERRTFQRLIRKYNLTPESFR